MKIIYFMGKSASGKDTIYKKVKERLNPSPKEIILYTTRPIRDHEENGREYFFVSDQEIARMESAGKIIEKRVYHTVYGDWIYATADDGQFDENSTYMTIGTLESYLPLRAYFGEEAMIPVYLEVEDGIRLERAIARERTQKTAKYEEMCRRFLADQADFSEENLKAAKITRRFPNEDMEACLDMVLEYIKQELGNR
jgi:guanylate kinase